MLMACALFLLWTGVAFLTLTYVVYPLAILALATRRLSGANAPLPPAETVVHREAPAVSVVLCAFNEASVIVERLQNVLAAVAVAGADAEILLACDGSTDDTVQLARTIEDPRVRVFAFADRRGKNARLNALIADTRGQFLVFTDANTMFKADALDRLLGRFSDSTVGCVGGEERRLDKQQPLAGSVCGSDLSGDALYMSSEARLKAAQSRLNCFCSCNGAIFAIRRELFAELPLDVPNDLQTPLDVWRQGKRVVYCAEALCFEPAPAWARDNYRRKQRIIARAFTCVSRMLPVVPRWVAASLICHKVLRWMSAFWLLCIFVGTALLCVIDGSMAHRAALVLQLVVYGLAVGGVRIGWRRQPKSTIERGLALFAYPLVVIGASATALIKVASGTRFVTWEHARSSDSGVGR